MQNTGLHEQYKPCRLMCTARLPVVKLTDPPPIEMDSSVSPKDKIWFLRVCHHISNKVY